MQIAIGHGGKTGSVRKVPNSFKKLQIGSHGSKWVQISPSWSKCV